ncbi:hypothetical protein MY11210_003473 [Beauveria gryllotalpidicola]
MATAARWPASLASSREDMINWNPDVSTTVDGTFYDCINLWPQQQICVSLLPTLFPRLGATPTLPYPVGKGTTVCGCKKWYKIRARR